VRAHASAKMRNARRDAWQAYAERRGGGRVPIGAVRASTEAHHLVLAGLTANVVVDIPEPPRPRGRRISGTGVFRVLISVSVFRGWRRISGTGVFRVLISVSVFPRLAPDFRQCDRRGVRGTCPSSAGCPHAGEHQRRAAAPSMASTRRPLRRFSPTWKGMMLPGSKRLS
jgi:hypothetical protein